MTKGEFELLFRMECRQHNVKVKMKWIGDLKTILARYKPYKKIVEFTRRLLNLDYATVMWIIRHEIAHAMDYQDMCEDDWYICEDAAHGESWKRCCKIMGCPASQFVPI